MGHVAQRSDHQRIGIVLIGLNVNGIDAAKRMADQDDLGEGMPSGLLLLRSCIST